jgi:hypothetical protein
MHLLTQLLQLPISGSNGYVFIGQSMSQCPSIATRSHACVWRRQWIVTQLREIRAGESHRIRTADDERLMRVAQLDEVVVIAALTAA